MKIAHLSAEVSPFARTGGLGDVVSALPLAQAELGHAVAVWMPYYREVREELARRGARAEPACEPFEIAFGGLRTPVALLQARLPDAQVPVFFVRADPWFDRPHLYYVDAQGQDDGLVRYSVFVRAALEGMRRLERVPDVLQSHDWHAALAPVVLAWDPPDGSFARTATVHTLHNLAYQGTYPVDRFAQLGLPDAAREAVLWNGSLNLMKAALVAADGLAAVSPTFAWEITTPDGGFGLDAIVRQRQADLVGIVNGLDDRVWNPARDRFIPYRYDRGDLSNKAEDRRTLLTMAGLNVDDPELVVGIVGRLTVQKGYDLLFPVLDELLADGVRFVFLGTGERWLEQQLRTTAARARGQLWAYIGFDDTLAHLIEAGADAFLMPSRFEPCGLNQLYSLAYGTPPIVRRVGGLADTVVSYDGNNLETATGFGFDAPESAALRETVRWAARCHRDPGVWGRLINNGMARDFRWRRSAERYLELYERLLNRRRSL